MEGRTEEQYLIGGFFGIFALVIVLLFCASSLDSSALRSSSLAAVVASVLVDLANQNRAESGVHGLAVSPLLAQAAQEKADDMASKGYFAHTSPDGKTPWYWFGAVGYSFAYAGENLAVDFSDSQAVEDAWMNSPAHRANILDAHFTEVGIATAEGTYQGRPATFVVEEFGTPAAADKFSDIRASVPEAPAEPALAVAADAPAAGISASPATSAPPVARAASASASSSVLAASAAVEAPAPPAPWWARLLASPKSVLSYSYAALALLVVVALLYATELEWKRRHLPHVFAACALFILMLGLFALADAFIFAGPVLVAAAS
ncbi:MAG TPA: CAP domain-containing protein [Candidatus Paceibacterota bacterium]|nr:CAP domain-containing protein [Candidatus Paceibacterota bacterium]